MTSKRLARYSGLVNGAVKSRCNRKFLRVSSIPERHDPICTIHTFHLGFCIVSISYVSYWVSAGDTVTQSCAACTCTEKTRRATNEATLPIHSALFEILVYLAYKSLFNANTLVASGLTAENSSGAARCRNVSQTLFNALTSFLSVFLSAFLKVFAGTTSIVAFPDLCDRCN